MSNTFKTNMNESRDAHEVADYLNFGGRLGTGQSCNSGQDCATDACGKLNRCHCQTGPANDGCSFEETCIVIEDGVHACASNTSGVIQTEPSNHAYVMQFQSSVIFIPLIFLRLLFFR